MRSFILVTGGRDEALQPAIESGADLVCVDMDDTVEDKAAAFALARKFTSSPAECRRGVRTGPVRSAQGLRDLLTVVDGELTPDFVCLPQVEHPADLEIYATVLPEMPVVPIIETPGALELAFGIAKAAAPIMALTLGGKDLSEAVGSARSWDGLRYARERIVQAAATANLPVFDEPYRPLEDLDGLRETCARLRDIGFTGKTTIDPGQVATLNEAFS